MEIVKKFFTETPTIIELFSLISGVSLGGSLIFHCLPEEKTFSITVDNTVIENIKPADYEWIGGTGTIDRLILSNEEGKEVGLEGNNFLGETLED